MSLQISLQKTNPSSSSKDRVIVRRHTYDKETQKTKAGKVIFSCNIYKIPSKIPQEKIELWEVTEEEQRQFEEFAKAQIADRKESRNAFIKDSVGYALGGLTDYLKGRSDGISLDEIEHIEGKIKALKVELSRHKKNEKQRQAKQ